MNAAQRERRDALLLDAAGIVGARYVRQTGGLVSIYRADDAGVDTMGERYAVVCEDHGSIVSATTLRAALESMRGPIEWCEECRTDYRTFGATHAIPFGRAR